MTRGNLNPNTIRDALNTLDEVLTGRRHGTRQPEGADTWRNATRAPTARCEDAGHRYQVVGRHKPTEVRCAEPGCGAGPWPVGGAR